MSHCKCSCSLIIFKHNSNVSILSLFILTQYFPVLSKLSSACSSERVLHCLHIVLIRIPIHIARLATHDAPQTCMNININHFPLAASVFCKQIFVKYSENYICYTHFYRTIVNGRFPSSCHDKLKEVFEIP